MTGMGALIKLRGEDTARLFHASQEAAVTRIDQIVGQLGISCNFRRLDAFLFPAMDMGRADARDEREKEYEAAQKAGVAAERVQGVPLKGFENAPALRYPNQATFHPLQYLQGLAAAIGQKGGEIFAETPVTKIDETAGNRPRPYGARHRQRRARGIRHQFADQHPVQAAQQDGAVPHLCHGVHAARRRAAGCALLGYGRSVSLRAPRGRPGQFDLPDRRR